LVAVWLRFEKHDAEVFRSATTTRASALTSGLSV
jgi:hypothetical protein